MNRLMMSAGVVGAVVACASGGGLTVTLVDTAPLPTSATDQFGNPFTIAGVSGVTHLGSGRYAAVLDNSDKVFEFDLSLDAGGSVLGVTPSDGLTLDFTADHEGIAPAGPAGFLVCDEGGPGVTYFQRIDGGHVGTVTIPAVFSNRRTNLGFESLTRLGDDAWVANEEALSVDGPRATPTNGTVVRLLAFDPATGTPGVQHAYEVDPMHGGTIPIGSPGQSGLSDLVLLPGGRLLALERSLAFATPLFEARVYEVDVSGATDVSGIAALDGAAYTPASKVLLWAATDDTVGNLEGLTLGQELSGGGHALVGVVDDGDPLSANQLVVLRLDGLGGCAADIDGDGDADPDDIQAFVDAFIDAVPANADIDGDGDEDPDDIAAFVGAFIAGCG